MDDEPNTTDRQPGSEPKRRSRLRRWLWIAIAFFALAGAAGFAFIASELAVATAARIMIARSDGRLAIEGASGSLLSLVRIRHLAWRGPGGTLAAEDIALDWSPLALWSRGIVVKALGAQRIALTLQPSDTATALPTTLALPTTITIGKIAVAEFEWTIGPNSGRITGVTFGYAGSPTEHRVEHLSLVLTSGTLTGDATVAAQPPFAVKGAFAFDGNVQRKRAHADIAVAGTIDSVGGDASGRAGDAQFALHARLTPFAAVALEEIALDAQGLDLAAWDPALPTTRLDIKAEGRPANEGIAGRFEAQNAIAGPLDAQRFPVRSVSARFAWRRGEADLDDLVATLARGRVSGSAQIPLDGGAGKWRVDVTDIDLREFHSTLAPTRLSGALSAELESTRQSIDARLSDRSLVGGLSASFAATLVERKLSVQRFQIRGGDGELAGSGAIELAGSHPFEVNASARRVDPSRFGNFPAGRIDGQIAATGELDPSWRVTARVAIASGSTLAGVPLAGKIDATLAPRTVRDATIDLTLASAHLAASGSFGPGADALTLAFDAPRLAELAPLLPARVPRPLAGALSVNATAHGDIERGGLEVKAHGDALKIGGELALGTFDARASVAPAAVGNAQTREPEARRLQVELAATGLVTRPGTFSRARATVDGTLAQHKATLAFAGEDLEVDASAHGGLLEVRAPDGGVAWTWKGVIDTLENRGPWAFGLDAPAALEVARAHIHVGEARLRVADGNVALGDFAWDEGRITTRGSFAGVPVTTVAKLAGVKLPFVSTVTLGGDWSLAAAPRLNGSVAIRREQGDLAFASDTGLSAADRAFRVASAQVAARFTDDALAATASIRSERGLNADAELTIDALAAAPPGRLSRDAPLRLALKADLATLKVLQPWIGTTAVIDGRAHAELVASGTLARAPWSGSVRADSMRIDAPQYGVLFTEGRLAARLEEGTITLDELAFVGGAGRFTASGSLATAGALTADGEGAVAQMTWRAEKFRVLNRPDLRLVVDGSGTVGLKNRKISLNGALVADEGHFEYKPDASAQLGDDVVVMGRDTPEGGQARQAKLPLYVDLDLDLGGNLTFIGEGLETGLRGKVHVTTSDDGTLRGRGSIQMVNGRYYAFGQRLVIDRGRLIFDGPLDNPGLDIVALRKNLAVEAGVAVSGTVKVPIVQLTSNPPVPDNEKLSWLILGHGVSSASNADMAALQAASAALLSGGGKPVTATFAQSIGLDEISVGRSSSAAYSTSGSSPDAANQVVSFGKRISDRLTLVYEQGLTVAKNALRLEYSLTRTLTLRAEAGAISSVGVYYRRVFD
jgi:translocation and assembly module TamB